MKRYIISVVSAALCLLATQSDAWLLQKSGSSPVIITPTGGQILASLMSGTLSNTTDRYFPVGFGDSPSVADKRWSSAPASGNITAFYASVIVPPAGVSQWQVFFRKNLTDAGSCTITSSSLPAGTCSLSTTISIAVHDTMSVRFHPINTPSVVGNNKGSMSAVFVPTVANNTIILAATSSSFSATLTTAVSPFINGSAGTPASRRGNVLPLAGTMTAISADTNAPGTAGSGQSYSYNVYKNGSLVFGSSPFCGVSETQTQCADASGTLPVLGPSGNVAGDDIQFTAIPSVTVPAASTATLGAVLVPTITGDFPLMTTSTSADDTALATYYPISSGLVADSATESDVQIVFPASTFTTIAVKLPSAPGVGNSRDFRLRINQVDTPLFCSIAGTNTACTLTLTGGAVIAVSDFDRLSTSDIPTAGTPPAVVPAISYAAFR
jgi:hypothetical protein